MGCAIAISKEVIPMQTIQAKIDSRLLSKVDRLFTGTLSGRIIEILQNARRAGATEVSISNQDGRVTVQDNGCGIADFSNLLDLGKSGWDESLEEAEDPAGVGIFCLAPRELEIRSGSNKILILGKGWTGEPIQVQQTDTYLLGTTLVFADEPWTFDAVQMCAVFSGLLVTVDGRQCESEPFVSAQAVHHPDLGCRIEVIPMAKIGQWHNRSTSHRYADTVLVNFHGQVVAWSFRCVNEDIYYLVDMANEPTSIRLMLPARTRLVENEAFNQLKQAIELEAYRYIQKRGSHKLKYAEYCRASELGIALPEAEPVFTVGLLSDEPVEPVEVFMPDGFPPSKCYRVSDDCHKADDQNEANTHLLAALGKFDEPFVPVEISSDYDGYSWASLPTIDSVEVRAGKELARQYVWREILVAVETLQISVRTSDGKTLTSDVPMAVREPVHEGEDRSWVSVEVMVTPSARTQLGSAHIWYHLGGWSDEGDTYDTQLSQFDEELQLFWSTLIGPGEYLRARLLDCLRGFELDWQTITIDSAGTLSITNKDGSKEVFPRDLTQTGE
jgi:hypothetical protein